MADKPLDVIKEETTRQVVILVFGIVGGIVAIIVTRAGTDAAYRSTLKMQLALEGKRFCQRQADRWQLWADKAATVYNRERSW